MDAAVAEAARKAGHWVRCRSGCTQCCVGVFPISGFDALRLKNGLRDLAAADPPAAGRVRARALNWLVRNEAEFPGDSATGILRPDGDALFEFYANDEPCPALDPETGLCDLYESRPATCRLFGVPLRMDPGAVGVCELCFDGALEAEIEACAVDLDIAALETELAGDAAPRGDTIVAFCLAR